MDAPYYPVEAGDCQWTLSSSKMFLDGAGLLFKIYNE